MSINTDVLQSALVCNGNKICRFFLAAMGRASRFRALYGPGNNPDFKISEFFRRIQRRKAGYIIDDKQLC